MRVSFRANFYQILFWFYLNELIIICQVFLNEGINIGGDMSVLYFTVLHAYVFVTVCVCMPSHMLALAPLL